VRRELALALTLIPACAFSQLKIHVELESGGPRTGWISDQLSAPPEGAAKWDGKSADISVAGAKQSSLVQILDTSSGNLAAKPLSEVSKGWLVKDSDFRYIGSIRLRVEHEGQAVSFATVAINDGKRPQEQLVDPTVNGEVPFYGVLPGQLKLTATYRSGNQSKSQKQSFELLLQRDTPVPLLVVSIPDNVVTLQKSDSAPAQASAARSPAPNSVAHSPSPLSRFGEVFLYLCAAGIAIMVVYFGFTWLQKNPQTTKNAFQKIGVPLQEPIPPDPATLAVVAPAPPSPPQQIILQDAAPDPIGPSPSPLPALGAVRLVGENGQTFDLPDGVSPVGREAGLPISLAGESSVSRHHAEIVRSGASVKVRDLGSTNGTFVNGVKISGEQTLSNGDTLQFGPVRLHFQG
jgi:hypothetical protein